MLGLQEVDLALGVGFGVGFGRPSFWRPRATWRKRRWVVAGGGLFVTVTASCVLKVETARMRLIKSGKTVKNRRIESSGLVGSSPPVGWLGRKLIIHIGLCGQENKDLFAVNRVHTLFPASFEGSKVKLKMEAAGGWRGRGGGAGGGSWRGGGRGGGGGGGSSRGGGGGGGGGGGPGGRGGRGGGSTGGSGGGGGGNWSRSEGRTPSVNEGDPRAAAHVDVALEWAQATPGGDAQGSNTAGGAVVLGAFEALRQLQAGALPSSCAKKASQLIVDGCGKLVGGDGGSSLIVDEETAEGFLSAANSLRECP
jgi:hypothetical protein